MITTNTSKINYLGNGVATVFPFSFKVWKSENLKVQITDTDGIIETVDNYTATITEDGGQISYLLNGSPLPIGYTLTILRDMPFEQDVDLITGTRFDPEVIETALDKATAERQQILEVAQRAVVVPPSSSLSSEEFANELFSARNEAVAKAEESAQSAQIATTKAEESSSSEINAKASEEQARQYAESAAQAGSIASDEVYELGLSTVQSTNPKQVKGDINRLEGLIDNIPMLDVMQAVRELAQASITYPPSEKAVRQAIDPIINSVTNVQSTANTAQSTANTANNTANAVAGRIHINYQNGYTCRWSNGLTFMLFHVTGTGLSAENKPYSFPIAFQSVDTFKILFTPLYYTSSGDYYGGGVVSTTGVNSPASAYAVNHERRAGWFMAIGY